MAYSGFLATDFDALQYLLRWKSLISFIFVLKSLKFLKCLEITFTAIVFIFIYWLFKILKLLALRNYFFYFSVLKNNACLGKTLK